MRRVLLAVAASCLCSVSFSQDFSDPFQQWPIDFRIHGKILIGADFDDEATLANALKESDVSGFVSLLVDRQTPRDELMRFASVFSGASDYRVVKWDEESDFKQIAALLSDCQTLVWRSLKPLTERQLEQLGLCHADLSAFIARGGTLIFLGPAAECVAELSLQGDEHEANTLVGLGLLPDCFIEFAEDDDHHRKLILECLSDHRTAVGVCLAPRTLLRLAGRTVSATGTGTATFMLAGRDSESAPRIQTIKAADSRRQPSFDSLIDLTQWRREAIDRTLPPFPPENPHPPRVENGTLVIVGGGGMPKGLMSQFIEFAGGVNEAKLVYVPCSESEKLSADQSTVEQWRKMGVKNATFIHTKDRNKANSDEAFLSSLQDATGLWFGGGRQWNFSDSYYGTKAQALMKEVLARGGVVGGSSAGASIQAQFLARATPIGNSRILAPGYERGGLGFITGVAIDQHFSRRGREKDMTQLVDRYPQLLGIGIDETTALIVQGSVAEVVGEGDVYFYDRNLPVPDDGPDYIKLAAGSSYDLVRREVLQQVEREMKDE